MKKSLLLYIVVILSTVLLPACNQITKSIDDTLNGRPRRNKIDAFMSSDDSNSNTSNFLTDANALAQAEAALRNLPELKGKKINVYSDLHMYDDGRIMIKIQDPDTLQNVNGYDYSSDKVWGARQPLNIGSNATAENVSSESITLDSIHFKNVAKMAATYADSAKHVGSTTRISHIYYVPEVKKWYCNSMVSTRSSYEIYFNPNGTIKEFVKE
jgi:hypothetical protein